MPKQKNARRRAPGNRADAVGDARRALERCVDTLADRPPWANPGALDGWIREATDGLAHLKGALRCCPQTPRRDDLLTHASSMERALARGRACHSGTSFPDDVSRDCWTSSAIEEHKAPLRSRLEQLANEMDGFGWNEMAAATTQAGAEDAARAQETARRPAPRERLVTVQEMAQEAASAFEPWQDIKKTWDDTGEAECEAGRPFYPPLVDKRGARGARRFRASDVPGFAQRAQGLSKITQTQADKLVTAFAPTTRRRHATSRQS